MPKKPTAPPQLPELIVSTPATLEECLTHLAGCPHIAFDTEFVGEDTYRPDLCLVQVATPERLYLIDPLTCGDLKPFWELVVDPQRVVIVHAGREEMRMCQFGIGRPPAHVFDLQIAAGLVGFTYPIGYASLVQELLGQRLHKGETLTDWRRRPLTSSQQQYAFDDVRFLIPIWKKLHEKLRRLTREDWASEEFAAFVRRSVSDDPAVEKWRKLKGIGGLDSRSLAVARELYHWRDQRAAQGNRPPRTVVRDDLLSDLARRPPGKLEELLSYRGITKTDAPHILEAIRRAKALPVGECPEPEGRENDPPHVLLLSSLLGVILSEWCARNKMASNLVATTTDLKRLVRARQPGGTPFGHSALKTGWRQRVVLPELEAFLDGKRSLIVESASSQHPLRVAPAETKPA
ncbi:ribonuclease D [Limnoglobus roseus]|uniref:Ribonuclease D n=1 Tax=Limnoglobus roseus TaxID=2598579 RepID=A0A5C1AQR8_9BACT|nr:ribonuclease D [Limnoglobus roseus]QEL19534.1 ribonuclease D [Limnoglobus roseus]